MGIEFWLICHTLLVFVICLWHILFPLFQCPGFLPCWITGFSFTFFSQHVAQWLEPITLAIYAILIIYWWKIYMRATWSNPISHYTCHFHLFEHMLSPLYFGAFSSHLLSCWITLLSCLVIMLLSDYSQLHWQYMLCWPCFDEKLDMRAIWSPEFILADRTCNCLIMLSCAFCSILPAEFVM